MYLDKSQSVGIGKVEVHPFKIDEMLAKPCIRKRPYSIWIELAKVEYSRGGVCVEDFSL
jgi:hypothetical protein